MIPFGKLPLELPDRSQFSGIIKKQLEVVERFLAILVATHRKIHYKTYCPKTVIMRLCSVLFLVNCLCPPHADRRLSVPDP